MRFASLTRRIDDEGAAAWALHETARAAQARGEDVILLSVGDPDFATPAPIVRRAVAALEAGDTHYTEIVGRAALRAAIAAAFSERAGAAFGPDHVVVFAGAQNALFAAALCLLEPGDEVIALDPGYVTYGATMGAGGARLVRVAQPAAGGFRPDPAAIAAAVTPRTRALLIASPNNPTGVVLTPAETEAVAAVARAHDLWVIADEVYADLVFEGRATSIAGLPGMAARVVTVSSLSKSHAMTGWRIGWAVAPEALARHFARLGLCMLYGLPGFAQEAALEALARQAEVAAEMRAIYRRRRDLVLDRLAAAPGLRLMRPEAGMFVLADVRALGPSAGETAWALFRETGVAALDATAFGPAAAGWIRIAFTLEDARLAEACDRIAAFARRRAPDAA
jgi:aspartate/methionine/tyrosine aminotransferase